MGLAHAAGDQLRVLGAEVDDEDGVEVLGHGSSLSTRSAPDRSAAHGEKAPSMANTTTRARSTTSPITTVATSDPRLDVRPVEGILEPAVERRPDSSGNP